VIAVVTVLYRSRAMLEQTLPTWVKAAQSTPVEFVFVDNDPADGCRELIGEHLDTFTYLPDPANAGFAAGCNRGAAATGASHVMFLNPDVWLAADTLSIVDQQVGDAPLAVGLNQYTGIDLHVVSLFIDRRAGRRRGPLGPSGGGAVFPRTLFLEHGGFCAEMFAWGEDADLAFRLWAAGVRTRALDLGLRHASGHSVGGDPELLGKRAFWLARNRVMLIRRTFSRPLLLVALPWLAACQVVLGLIRLRQGLLRPFARGVAAGLRTPSTTQGPRFGLRHLWRYLR
jgi:N-acetylglucosaminyl-diphospho-decaprenol L-rhamnosyltransferase